jgi:hypothetical protein
MLARSIPEARRLRELAFTRRVFAFDLGQLQFVTALQSSTRMSPACFVVQGPSRAQQGCAARPTENMVRIQIRSGFTIACFAVASFVAISEAHAQKPPRHIALKSGESTELRNFYFVQHCRSLMIGTPVVDVLEGPEELTVSLKQGEKVPAKCTNRVPGGTVMATAKNVTTTKQAKLTIRLKFNTKVGERQSVSSFLVSLYP